MIPRRALERFAPLALLLLALAALAIAPIGYVGGGADDTNYLEASRCWVAAGHPCLPHSHWATRWPAILPTALFTALFGESRLTVGLGPLCAWAACVVLLAALGRAWFDRSTGYLAAALLATTPGVTQVALQPGTDVTELAFQLAALLLATVGYKRQSAALSVAAGAAAALASQARDTSILFCGAAALAWLLLDRERRKVLLWSIAGFVAVVAIELATYAGATGDPFYRYGLALAHVTVPSAELSPSVDTRQSPLFNPAYIAGWRREAGITLWWPLDPWLNLLWSPRIGLLLAGSALGMAFGWPNLPPAWKRTVGRACGFALLIAIGLVYALAVDPKPRMFFALVGACALGLAAVTVASSRKGRGLVPACVAALAIFGGLFALSRIPNTHELEHQASRWIATHPGAIEVDARTRNILTLLPEARALPAAGAGRPLRLQATTGRCEAFGVPVVESAGTPATGELCLLRLNPAAGVPKSRRP
jgi:4-amino-4-deoxy-L-arabinose transferase-like glycosyltransferase